MKVLTIFGTRPEAIKLAPVIKELEKHPEVASRVCVTAQHREMLDQVLELFGIDPDWDLNLMRKDQSLFDITARGLQGLEGVFKKEQPDVVLVQGDTTTAFVASLAAYYLKVKIGHVEAGLRTEDKYSPFPEEMNRRLTDVLSDVYFVPTRRAKQNLFHEGIPAEKIFVTGNTVIDALLWFEVTSIGQGPEAGVRLFAMAFGFGFGWHAIVDEVAKWARAFKDESER